MTPAKPQPRPVVLCCSQNQYFERRDTLLKPRGSLLSSRIGEVLEAQSQSHGRNGAARFKLMLPPPPPPHMMAVRRSFESVEVLPLSKSHSVRSGHDEGSHCSHKMSKSVERLIRETDEGFRVVGSALAEARASTQVWEIMARTSSEVNDSQERRVEVINGNNELRAETSENVSKPSSNAFSARFRKGRMPSILQNGRKTKTKQKQVRKSSNLLGLAFKDVLTGRAFRMEVDELPHRSPARLPVDEVKERHFIDSNTSLGWTSTDPFQLESVKARIEAVRDKEQFTAQPILSWPNEPSSDNGIPTIVRTNSEASLLDGKTKTIILNGTNTAKKAIKFHPPPAPKRRKSKIKHRPTLSKENMLKSIPEMPTPLASPARLPVSNGKAVLTLLHTARQPPLPPPKHYIILCSTRLTKTAPLFCHGPIKIEKPERAHEVFSPVDAGLEDRLDWTAFQMAILGTEAIGGGNWRRNWGTEVDEREVDDIMDWWDSFGFKSYGHLERSSPPPPVPPPLIALPELPAHSPNPLRKQRRRDKSRTARTIFGEIAGIPMHYGRSITMSRSSSTTTCSSRVELNGTPMEPAPGVKGRRSSTAESLPPSPMLDLSADGEAKVPMGYNLGHDLEDFLRWEMEHVGMARWD